MSKKKDITGLIFGLWEVIKFSHRDGTKYYWECKCACGIIHNVRSVHLVNGKSKSCGCINKLKLTGKRFSNLLVLDYFGLDKFGQTLWNTICDCGKHSVITGSFLVSGHTRSCGCLGKNNLDTTTHGMSKTRIFKIWVGMLRRCLDSKCKSYLDYGGRGIKVCDEWLDFEQFWKDEGQSYLESVVKNGEKNTTADRFPDVNGNYEPSNFRWATIKEQQNNKRTTPKTKDLKEHRKQRGRWCSFLNSSLRNNRNSQLFEKRFGISVEGFIKYIESQFKEGMCWSNHGTVKGTWQLDHINGCNNFDLSIESERYRCNFYTNFQPLWYEDHLHKSKLVTI